MKKSLFEEAQEEIELTFRERFRNGFVTVLAFIATIFIIGIPLWGFARAFGLL